MPPSQRCSYECNKSPTGPLNRKKLIEHINKQALETPDIPELKPYVPGVIRGKKVSTNYNNSSLISILYLYLMLFLLKFNLLANSFLKFELKALTIAYTVQM